MLVFDTGIGRKNHKINPRSRMVYHLYDQNIYLFKNMKSWDHYCTSSPLSWSLDGLSGHLPMQQAA